MKRQRQTMQQVQAGRKIRVDMLYGNLCPPLVHEMHVLFGDAGMIFK